MDQWPRRNPREAISHSKKAICQTGTRSSLESDSDPGILASRTERKLISAICDARFTVFCYGSVSEHNLLLKTLEYSFQVFRHEYDLVKSKTFLLILFGVMLMPSTALCPEVPAHHSLSCRAALCLLGIESPGSTCIGGPNLSLFFHLNQEL